jgi:hypothetical protein
MNLVLAGLNWKMCHVYIDDMLMFLKTFKEHINHIKQVFDHLRDTNMKLKLHPWFHQYYTATIVEVNQNNITITVGSKSIIASLLIILNEQAF